MVGVQAKPLISKEIADFLESGVALVVGTRDDELQPDGAGAWAVRVAEDGAHLTLYMFEDAARDMLRNLERHPEIAIDCDSPTTHRACQVKGVYLSHRAATDAERALIDRQVEAFATDLEAIGIPRAMTTAWQVWPCIALELRATQIFEQTPGPGTGEPIA
jgi:hypothetical protein